MQAAARYNSAKYQRKKRSSLQQQGTRKRNGAGERIRTVDSYLGKVALYQLSYARIREQKRNGAGERIRTVDSYLGKVALYQLSYARMEDIFRKRA